MKKAVILAALTAMLGACAQKDDPQPVSTQGNCSVAFVADYNQVVLESKTDAAAAACKSFQTKHKKVTCKAEVENQIKTLSTVEIETLCSSIKPAPPIEKPSAEKPPVETPSVETPSVATPVTKPDINFKAKVTGTQNKYGLQVKDSEKFKELFARSGMVVINGQVYDSVHMASDEQHLLRGLYCLVFPESGSFSEASISAGTTLIPSTVREQTGSESKTVLILAIEFKDAHFTLGCSRRDSKPYTWADLHNSFRDILEIKEIK